ncbi:MAG: hypothetical protein AB7F86_00110 [Bdellovibrionales bacterium]
MNKNLAFFAVLLLTSTPAAYAAERDCDPRALLAAGQSEEASLWALLDQPIVNGAQIIRHLQRHPEFAGLYAADAGVWEKYSIEQHTLMVFDTFAEQFGAYRDFYKFDLGSDIRLLQTLKFVIALHDIGKPHAIKAGDKNRQHEFTVPILKEAMKRYGFSREERKLGEALVGNDVLGDLVKGNISAGAAKERLVKSAERAGLEVKVYVPVQLMFYTIDAASYPTLRQRIFTIDDGLLVPNRGQFRQLWQEMAKP